MAIENVLFLLISLPAVFLFYGFVWCVEVFTHESLSHQMDFALHFEGSERRIMPKRETMFIFVLNMLAYQRLLLLQMDFGVLHMDFCVSSIVWEALSAHMVLWNALQCCLIG